ncbi:hypothetical protein C2S51_016357 [Perilla frutescens var. frutescens]|nr:hypothetical protein C2S51_016357 [Perilla frutescens var. frutescens]
MVILTCIKQAKEKGVSTDKISDWDVFYDSTSEQMKCLLMTSLSGLQCSCTC